MPFISRFLSGRGLVCAGLVVLFAVPARLSGEQTADRPIVVGNEKQQKAWTDSISLLGRGRFEEAALAIRKMSEEPGVHKSVQRIEKWMESYEKLHVDRQKRIKLDYDKYVDWVRQDQDKYAKGDQHGIRGWWRLAMVDVSRAFASIMDEDTFRKEAWLPGVIDGSLKAAREYEEKGKWLSAASIYARLKEIFPLNKDYRAAVKRCQSHIRIELTYTPDSEWENEVNSIVPEMAIDAFRKVESEYLREVDFKELTVEALSQIQRLIQEKSIVKAFPGMKDGDAVAMCTSQIKALLEKAKKEKEMGVDDLIQALNNVLRINRQNGTVFPETVLVYEFVQGAFQPLDEFTDMIWPSNVQEFQKHTQGKFSGVGIQIRKAAGDPILVISPLKGSPAYEKGIRPGDLITKINGESSNGYTINRAVREITGRVGTTVKLTIKRPDTNEEFEVELERREIKISTIKGVERIGGDDWNFMIDPEQKIGYVRLTHFTDECAEELNEALTKLVEEQGLRGLIFDLRGNPGGPLKAAIDVSETFLQAEKKIVSTRGRKGNPWTAPLSHSESKFSDFPMIVLVSPSSASASEIVSGALQVHNRALIVGERSFGKGSVQQVFPLTNDRNVFLKLTTSRYYLPNDRCLHREEDSTTWGVDPDVKVKLVPKEDIKINQLQLKTEILKGKDQKALTEKDVKSVTEYKATTKPASTTKPAAKQSDDDEDGKSGKQASEDAEDEPKITRTDDNNFPEIDPQLDTALLLMRVRLESKQPWPMQHEAMAAK